MDVSFVVPIKNAEKYLDALILSLLKQKGDFEILLIDNGSDDDSLKIAQGYAKNNKRIRVFSFLTPGASAVRNFGIKESKGKYIWFVDGDDKIEDNALEILLKKAEETGADVTAMNYYKVFPSPDGEKKINLTAFSPENIGRKIVWYGAGPWQFLFRKEFLDKNDIRFHEGIIHEDIALTPTLILYTDKIQVVTEPLYDYYQREESVVHLKKFSPSAFDIFPALFDVREKFKEYNKYQEYKDEIEYLHIWHLMSDSARDFKRFKRKDGIKMIHETMKTEFPKWRKNKYYREMGFLPRIRLLAHYLGVK